MKKIFMLTLAPFLFFACAGLQENYNMASCKYDLAKVEVADSDFSSVSMNVAIAVTNVSKTAAAALKRFDGNLYVNDTNISTLTLKDVRVEAGETKVVNSVLKVPIQNLGKSLAGLVAMGSVSVNYTVKGTMYFETPIGEVPFPVTIYQSKKI